MVLDTVSIPNATTIDAVVFSPDGNYAYAIDDSGYVWVVSTATKKVLSSVFIGDGFNYGLAITPDGKFLYVGAAPITVISTDTNQEVELHRDRREWRIPERLDRNGGPEADLGCDHARCFLPFDT